MSDITFKVPSKAKRGTKITLHERTGSVAYFLIGDQRIKFVLQYWHVHASDPKAREPIALTHYASGLIFGQLAHARLVNGAFTDREAAQHLIDNKVSALGAAAVLAVLYAAEVINT